MNFGRTFRITEKVSLNLRIEFQNVFNRGFFNDPRNNDITEARSTVAPYGNVNPNSGFGAINAVTGVAGAGNAAIVNLNPRNGVLVARFSF